MGVLIIKEKEGYKAFKHAWVEVYEEKKWQKVDALYSDGAETVYHFPVNEFEDESMGYNSFLLSAPIVNKIILHQKR